MKSLNKAQLFDNITANNFNLGYVQGNSVVNIRSKADLDEIWEGLKKDKALLCGVMAYQLRKTQVVRGQSLLMKPRVTRRRKGKRKRMAFLKWKKFCRRCRRITAEISLPRSKAFGQKYTLEAITQVLMKHQQIQCL